MLNGSRDKQEDLVAEFKREFKVLAIYAQADFAEAEHASEHIMKLAVETFGTVHILVNNAGIQHVSPVDSFDAVWWNKVMNINLNSCFHLIKASIKLMKAHPDKWGRIVNISSVHGIVGSVNKSAYVTAKHGLNGLTKVVALETASDTNITCNAICPGWVRTPLVEKQIEVCFLATAR